MIGRTISRYKIIEKLGEGGMGVVYKAEDIKLKRTVALKFLSPQAVGVEEDKARLIHEAQVAAALNHPNICTVHEIDEYDDLPFIAMECVEGESLKAKIKSGPLGINEAVGIAVEIAKGLQEAHNKGIIHRDIKSSNIMLTAAGRVKVMDFGLAKSSGGTQLTRSGTTMGTVAYMSPEQARGGGVDHRSDIWSLGVVLFEMVAGRLPFRGDHEQAVLYSIVNEEAKPITDFVTGVPTELDTVFRKCLAKDPGDRYQTVAAFIDDLGRFRDAQKPGTRQLPSKRREGRSTRRWPWIVAAAVVIAATIAIWPRLFPATHPRQNPKRSMLVVLPFENLGSPEDEYFADGITEELTARLAKIEGLGVIARTSAIQYKNTSKTIDQIGKELNVQYVLEGTIRWEREGGSRSRIRVTPQLIRVSDATHLWADIYQRDMTGIFEVQADIAGKVADALNIKLLDITREAIEVKPTDNLEAYNAYLQGMEVLHLPDYRWEAQEFAIQMFERAVDLDPEFTAAYVQLSIANSGQYMLGYDRTDTRIARSEAAVDRALELEPDNPEVHMALAYYYYWCHGEYDLALKHFAIAENGLPNESDVLKGVAFILRRRGQYEEAVAKLKTALEISPQDADIAMNLGETLTPMRRYEEAEKYLKLSIALAPGQIASYQYLGWTYRMWNGDTVKPRELLEEIPLPKEQLVLGWYLQNVFERDYSAALDQLTMVSTVKPFIAQWWFYPKAMLEGIVHRLAGDAEKAEAAFETARDELEAMIVSQPDDARIHSALGITYAGLGRKEDAIREGKLAMELLPVSKDAFIGPRRVEDLALIYTMVGEYEAALDTIEYMLSIPGYFSLGLLRLDPRWDPLRDHPRYRKLMEGET
ncbi:MAG: protein kinase [bacterium]